MERKFKITVEGRQYNVAVEELTDSPYSEPPVFLPPSAHLAPAIAPARSMNNHGPAHAQVNHAEAEAGDVVSTLSGVVESVLVTVGQQVAAGERVLVVEAMKMKTPITARQDGTVSAILVQVGDGVVPGQALVKLG
jgi:biotin carboxyl carrier protein